MKPFLKERVGREPREGKIKKYIDRDIKSRNNMQIKYINVRIKTEKN